MGQKAADDCSALIPSVSCETTRALHIRIKFGEFAPDWFATRGFRWRKHFKEVMKRSAVLVSTPADNKRTSTLYQVLGKKLSDGAFIDLPRLHMRLRNPVDEVSNAALVTVLRTFGIALGTESSAVARKISLKCLRIRNGSFDHGSLLSME
jgi:hypothetical protein